MSLEVDMSRLRDKMTGLYDSVGGDASEIVRGEGARLNMQIIKITPPLGPGGKNAGAKKAGEQAIEKELRSLFSEAEPYTIDTVGSQHGISNVHGFIEGKDGQPIEIKWDHLDPTGNRMAEYHQKYRDRRGKVRRFKGQKGKWQSRVVVPTGARDAYIRKVVARVGRWRASLAGALPALGKPVPAWIRRHAGAVSAISIMDLSRLNHPTKPELTFGSRAPGCDDPGFQQRCRAAVKMRVRAIDKRIRLVLSGYSRDVAQNMRPRKHAKETDTEPQEVLE